MRGAAPFSWTRSILRRPAVERNVPSSTRPSLGSVNAAERVRFTLAAERRRGTPFDLAWDRALAAAGREDWAAALDWARQEFQAAYEGRGGGRLVALGPLEREAESTTVVLA